ncbi:MAG: RluA family pseudouridine synthase [Bacteroidales bacterium]|nr:RluA family pseudouridine synthase [Bacteroidales bacterium]
MTPEVASIGEQILYEDNHLLILNKKIGQIVQADKTNDVTMPDLIRDFIRERDNRPGNVFCGVVHRLDRPVSGVVLFARTSKALTRMNEAVKAHNIKKTYWALTQGMPPEPSGHLENWLLRNETQNKSYVVKEGTPKAKLAILDYKLIGQTKGGYNLLEIDLHTGRHHQIRAQLSNMGCVIKGDLKYGAERNNPDGGISLHARKLEFIHPVRKEPMCIVAPVPQLPIWQELEDIEQA